jgi:hypothetical protein
MEFRLTTLERAFELARSGRYTSVADIKKQLSVEGYSTAQVTGRVMSRQLQDLIRTAQAAEADPAKDAEIDQHGL